MEPKPTVQKAELNPTKPKPEPRPATHVIEKVAADRFDVSIEQQAVQQTLVNIEEPAPAAIKPVTVHEATKNPDVRLDTHQLIPGDAADALHVQPSTSSERYPTLQDNQRSVTQLPSPEQVLAATIFQPESEAAMPTADTRLEPLAYASMVEQEFLHRIGTDEMTPSQTTTELVMTAPSEGDDDGPQISDADLEMTIAKWRAELDQTDDAEPDDAPPLETPAELLETDGGDLPVADISATESVAEVDATAADEGDDAELMPVPMDVAPAVEMAIGQLNEQLATLEPEAMAEVHQLLDEVLQEIDQLWLAFADANADAGIAPAEPQPDELLEEALDASAPLTEPLESPAMEVMAEGSEAIDTSQLEASLQRLLAAVGLNYGPEEVHSLVLQLLTGQPVDGHGWSAGLTAAGLPADWGTREGLQWFTSQLRSQHRRTNALHRLVDVVGRYALSALDSSFSV